MAGSDAARKVWPACKVVGSACDDGGFEGVVWQAGHVGLGHKGVSGNDQGVDSNCL